MPARLGSRSRSRSSARRLAPTVALAPLNLARPAERSDADDAETNDAFASVETLLESARLQEIEFFELSIQLFLARLADARASGSDADDIFVRCARARDLCVREGAARRLAAEAADFRDIQEIIGRIGWMTPDRKAAECKHAAGRFRSVRDRLNWATAHEALLPSDPSAR